MKGFGHNVRWAKRFSAIVLAVLAGVFLAGPLGSVSAQEDGEGAGRDDAKLLDVTKQAYYTHNLGQAAPPILTNQFPPAAVCLVAPELCTEDVRQVTGPVDGIVQDNQPETTIPSGGQGAITPGTLPVGLLAGAIRHEAAIRFTLPPVPEGHEVETFEVFLTETQPTFHSDSPAFRQTIVAMLGLIDQDPSGFTQIPSADLINSETFTGVEACPLVRSFESGDAQAGEEAPSGDATNCLLGANGERVLGPDGDTYWRFDLTLAANAWAEGRMPNEGILFQPITPQNAAYGDPDPSTSEQVTFEGADSGALSPAAIIETVEDTGLISLGGDSGLGVPTAPTAGAERTPSGRAEVFGGSENDPTDRGGGTGTGGGLAQGAPAGSDPVSPWWLWLLLPAFLGGGFFTAQGFTTDPEVTQERSGAMTRLLRMRGLDLTGGPS